MSNRIAEYRELAGLKQKDLAAKLGWVPSRLGNYESGLRIAGLDEARQIIDALNATNRVAVTLDDVFPPGHDRAA